VDEVNDTAPLPATVRYHLAESEIVAAREDPRRAVPSLLPGEHAILDIGCGIGQTLLAPELCSATVRCGVDVDADSIAYGQQQHRELDLRVAPAERLPFPDGSFDLVYSRVALPYTNMPVALRDAHRVLRPCGRIWITLHPPQMLRARTMAAIMGLRPKPIVDAAYIWLNSLLFFGTGRCVPRPWSGQFETVQTVGSMTRALRVAGFETLRANAGASILSIEGVKVS
jgi:ubiquinone/menaquinone biosynthesis C-methylase UbiE